MPEKIKKKSNEGYIKLRNEYNKILDENKNLTWILEGIFLFKW